jgi:hypothetical protein
MSLNNIKQKYFSIDILNKQIKYFFDLSRLQHTQQNYQIVEKIINSQNEDLLKKYYQKRPPNISLNEYM